LCFSFTWIAQLLIWAIALGAAFAIVALVINFVLPRIGLPIAGEIVSLVWQILKIAIWAAILIFIVIIAFDTIACLFSAGGPLPRLHG
jgi:hypothetical protein